jgi:hypothetical protein
MFSYSNYYRQRLEEQSVRLTKLDKIITNIYCITGKKRKFEDAMGYSIDSGDSDCKTDIQESNSIQIIQDSN